MSVRRSKAHHRPSVHRLHGGLGSFRWVADCRSCGFYRTTTFWRGAMVHANNHALELR